MTDIDKLIELAGRLKDIFPGPYITKTHPAHNHEKWGGLVEVMYAEDEWNALFQIVGAPKQPLSECEELAKMFAALDPETVRALCKELKELRLTTALPADVQDIDDPIKLNELAWRIVTKSAALYGNSPEDIDLEEIDIITVEILAHIKSTRMSEDDIYFAVMKYMANGAGGCFRTVEDDTPDNCIDQNCACTRWSRGLARAILGSRTNDHVG